MRALLIAGTAIWALGSGGAAAQSVPANVSPAPQRVPPLQAALGNPADLKVSGSIRLRFETLDGQPRAGLIAEDQAVVLRSILTAEYRSGALRIGAEIHDSRVLSGRTGGGISSLEGNALEPIQVYVGVDLGNALGRGSKSSLQFGRFTLAIGSRRFVTADEYRNATQGMTGARFDFTGPGATNATVFYVLPQVHSPSDQPSLLANRIRLDRESLDLQLWGGLLSRGLGTHGPRAEVGFYRLAERDAPGAVNRNRRLTTFSARLWRDASSGQVDYDLEAASQIGSIRTAAAVGAPRQDVAAWFGHAGLGYSFSNPLKLRLAATLDYASGDGPGGSYGRFDTLFGSRRAEFGPAGLFSAVGRTNLIMPALRAEIAPGKRFDAFVAWHGLWLADRHDSFSSTGVRDVPGRSGNFAGHEIEGRLRYWVIPGWLRGEINAVWLAKGRFLRTAPNAPRTGDTHYLAISATASF